MRWSLVARYSVIAVFAFIAIAVVIAFTLDFGRFKGNVETYVSELLNRDLTIEGPLSLTLGGTIDLSAEGVRLASTEWSAEPDLASMDPWR